MEALIRWISPTRGFVAPDASIAIAENSDLILQIGEIVAHQSASLDTIGIKTHVDDFGTGYSSLALRQSLSLDVLKIDRAFTANLGSETIAKFCFKQSS